MLLDMELFRNSFLNFQPYLSGVRPVKNLYSFVDWLRRSGENASTSRLAP